MKLRSQVAIITGSGQGIGKATAIEFMREHAKVILWDIDSQNTKEVQEHITKQGGVAEFMHCDITNNNQVKRCVAKVLETYGKIDVLVNCAGAFIQKPLTKLTQKEWDFIIKTNLKGTFNCTQAVANTMIKQKRGKIVMVSSIAGKAGLVNTAAFSSANGGIINLTKELTQELSPHNININAVSPGLVSTDFMKELIEDSKTREQLLANIPMKRLGTPEEIANAVLFLASKDSDFITGHNLVVDGGWKTH